MSNTITISNAAKQLNIGRGKLFAALRSRKILDANNAAQKPYADPKLFRNEQRVRIDRATSRQISYYVTVCTDEGLFFLREIANALQGTKRLRGSDGHDRATAEKEPNAVHGVAGAGPHSGISQ